VVYPSVTFNQEKCKNCMTSPLKPLYNYSLHFGNIYGKYHIEGNDISCSNNYLYSEDGEWSTLTQ
jgi:hypothetical protein